MRTENGERNGEALNEAKQVKTENGKLSALSFKLSALLLLLAGSVFAQSERSTDFGAVVGAKYQSPSFGKFTIGVEEELRFDNNCTQFDRWLNEVSVTYLCLHNRMRLGLAGGAVRRYNDKGYYENRARVGLDVTYAETVRRFKLSFRSRVMASFRDERIANYRVNPKLFWRNRFQVAYQIPNSRFKYALSTELRCLMNDPKRRMFDNLRSVLTVNYRLTRHQSLSAFLRMDHDLQIKNPKDRYYLGLTYHYKS